LIGDPQLLILDEPMNGLDPAGMREMRDMILSLVAEGRTVVLSSHLLDEVERTCDAVAIVDRGNIIRQGPISELLSGTALTVQVDCSEPDRARALLHDTTLGAGSPQACTTDLILSVNALRFDGSAGTNAMELHLGKVNPNYPRNPAVPVF